MNGPSSLKILLTNDDGIASPKLEKLACALSNFAQIFVVAPSSERSGVSHAFTGAQGILVRQVDGYDCPAFSVSGTPSDCVKFAVSEALCGGLPDLVVSGVNMGENAGVSALYSGTVAGAREAALWGIPGLALSVSDGSEEMLDRAIEFACKVVSEGLFLGMPKAVFWNVNFPTGNVAYKGLRLTRMSTDMFTDHYEPREGKYYLDGEKHLQKAALGTDDRELAEGYATLTPHKVDQTCEAELERLAHIDF